MDGSAIVGPENAVRALRRFAQRPADAEQCEFCSTALLLEHRHLVEIGSGKIICACDPCALRFENVIGRWKLIPRDARRLTQFQMADADWEALALPINLAFFVQSTPHKKIVAIYPSPAGATISHLPLAAWEALAQANSCLADMQPDVEALLVNRLGAARDYWIAPIDRCFELAGLVRVHWRGLSGGEKVWQEIAGFLETLSPGTVDKIERPVVPAQQEARRV